MQKEMVAYPVRESGKIGKGRVFYTLKQPPAIDNTGGDGLTIDTKGNLYIISRRGIQVFGLRGKLLGIIKLPEQPANVTFGGKDDNTLYVTARTSLYRAEMQSQGHVFPGQLNLDGQSRMSPAVAVHVRIELLGSPRNESTIYRPHSGRPLGVDRGNRSRRREHSGLLSVT